MREMKDSGIDWIGKIPNEWTRSRIKNACSMIGSGTTPDSHIVEYYENGTINWIQSGDIYGNDYIRDVSVKVTDLSIKALGALKLYKAPFITIAMYGGSVGNIAISLIDACANQACCCLRPANWVDFKYLFYWITFCKADFLSKAEGGGQPNISQDKIKNQWFYAPEIAEQNKIANYLEKKNSEYKATVFVIQAEIKTLEEYKQSIISEAVTKGLNRQVEMQHTTSDEWPQIPIGWSLCDIKYLFEIVKRVAGKEGYDVLSVTQRGLRVKDITSNEGQLADNYSGYQFVYPTDYVMNHMDLLTGWVDCSTLFGVTSPDYRVFRLRNKENNDLNYYKYVMQCCYMCKIFYSLGNGVSGLGRWRLQTSTFLNFQVPVPPLNEQKEIAKYLDEKIAEIDGVIAIKKQQLETLDAYKKSLIFEYVTGKKEVV